MCFYFATDPNLMALNNGLAPPHAEGAHLSEHQTGDKVKLARADQGDDAGTTFSFARTMNPTIPRRASYLLNTKQMCFLQVSRKPSESRNVSHHFCPTRKSCSKLEQRKK